MADTLFPKREERVPYGSGTPAKRDRKNTKGKKQAERTAISPQKKSAAKRTAKS